MAVISLHDIELGFGGPLLLDKISLQVEKGERVALLGRNGVGKSCFLKVLHGDIIPESGDVSRKQNLKTAYLPQEVPLGIGGKVEEIVRSGLSDADAMRNTKQISWEEEIQVSQAISKMDLNAGADFSTLSAGLKRRVLLARGLVREPELLLLDEPTNHLDIAAIDWLEDFLKRWSGTLVFVTHDRVFLQRLANRIVELDRGRLFDWNCSYQVFLDRKEAMLQSESEHNKEFDKKLAREETWIRRGLEARRTRNEGRVRALKHLRLIREERREQPGKVRLQIQEERRSGNLVLEAEKVSFSFDDDSVIKDFSLIIQRGDRIGIVGSNGSGKTTLLRLLLKELKPQQGVVEHGTNLEIAYFDQLRSQLDENKSVLDNVGQGRDVVRINGIPRNLIGYLGDFLFSADRVHAPISALSGGERNRLLLARLFTQPANLLVLDEPTNDLDIETLEILESMLMEYSGTMMIVSHDRAFLNNLVTSTLVLDGSGEVEEFIGGYEDWRKQAARESKTASTAQNFGENIAEKEKPRKLSYNEKRLREAQQKELKELPGKIELLEREQGDLSNLMADVSFYQQNQETIAAKTKRLNEIEEELESLFLRWQELEELLKD